ncbi:uncharacterized protein B0J16DRAFT_402455 [Fusarium flagelliforme]|uniref:uncharacterized protein n=1 Tax=Fusarium flagelliforme TaxID=2675880 RepID=UPI001E8E9D0D|nr:uncharacterized protein B0J16DRAFT_402455 [Fusarium flagelliforme]KAH7179082.1 hypothetical protein B0J16DRAFT_402455 [Fusarium flagelliforme]
MATRRLTFIETRAPRAAGLSEGAVDEHKELIGDLYLSQNYTRDQVIQHLKTNFGFNLSRDQFSKATRRWGFQKQRRGGSSIEPSLSEVATQSTTSDAARNVPPSTTNIDIAEDQEPTVTDESSKRPRSAASSISRRSNTTTHDSSSPFVRRLVKRMKPNDEPGNAPTESLPQTQLDFSNDTDLMLTTSVEEEVVDSRSRYEERYDDELSADYLVCCYRYNKAFWYYRKLSVPFPYESLSPKQRRDRILDMARTAKTRRASEIVKEMMESELETSNDPLSEDRSNQPPSGKAEMCPVQSFLFHRHLAEIYEHYSDDASLVQKHLNQAKGFTKAFDKLAPPDTLSLSGEQVLQSMQKKEHNAPPTIDLWTLLRLLPGYKVADIQENLLNSLEWDATSMVLDIRDCLDRCWGALNKSEPLPISMHYDAVQHEKMEPNEMSHLAVQHDPLYIWAKTSLLFTFLWTKIQDNTPPIWKCHTISATQFLMVISRMIVRESLLLSQHVTPPLDPEGRLLELRDSDRQDYRSVVQTLLLVHRWMPDQIKREFVTEFVEHYSWSPPAGRKSVLAQQIQTYQIEALKLVLAGRKEGESRPTTSTSTTLREVTTLKAEASEMGSTSEDNEFMEWLALPQDQSDSTGERDAIAYVKQRQYAPSFDSSRVSSSLRTSSIYLSALTGNPTMSRSLASRSSRSSQASLSSSFKRFKASALKRRNSSESMMGLSLYDPERQLQDDSFEGVQDLQVQRYLKVTMGLSTLEEEYTSLEGKPEEDEKPSVRGRIERLLKGKGKDNLNEREWTYNPTDDLVKSIPYHLLDDASARPKMLS